MGRTGGIRRNPPDETPRTSHAGFRIQSTPIRAKRFLPAVAFEENTVEHSNGHRIRSEARREDYTRRFKVIQPNHVHRGILIEYYRRFPSQTRPRRIPIRDSIQSV